MAPGRAGLAGHDPGDYLTYWQQCSPRLEPREGGSMDAVIREAPPAAVTVAKTPMNEGEAHD
jgi:hypothetical protein